MRNKLFKFSPSLFLSDISGILKLRSVVVFTLVASAPLAIGALAFKLTHHKCVVLKPPSMKSQVSGSEWVVVT